MKKLLILGAGTGGTIMANRMRTALLSSEWEISIVDQDDTHYYQPGFLFLPFGTYKMKDVHKPRTRFIPKGVAFIKGKLEQIIPEENKVLLMDGRSLEYDLLIIATGTRIVPEETPGMKGDLWEKQVFEFYTPEGARKLGDFLSKWEGGKMVINIAELPIKCPVAPLEFIMLADSYFTKKGIRDKVSLTYVVPMSGAFTKPICSKVLGHLLDEKRIEIISDYNIAEVNNEERKIVDYAGQEVSFDCLVVVPVHMGQEAIINSGLGDDLGFIPTDKYTLRSQKYENIFVLGDASNIPASKAGSVIHFASEVMEENILCKIQGKEFTAKFDGHANCYIETGFDKAALIDFNYEVEPLPGVFPLPAIGPFRLLLPSRVNHWGKLAFRWIYWNILLRGREIPTVHRDMSMAGKKKVA
jgi:sulfide:quinone oxidoreductase